MNERCGQHEHELGSFALHCELGHGVGNLLEEDGSEASVEAEDTVSLEHARCTGTKALGECGVRHGADADGLEGAEENVGDELGAGRGSQVDEVAVVPGSLRTDLISKLDLEELKTAELEKALHEVAGSGGAEARGQHTHTFSGDNLPHAADEAISSSDAAELDAGLDNIDGAESTVSDAAADTASNSTFEIVVGAELGSNAACGKSLHGQASG